jgi:hypothetical protein
MVDEGLKEMMEELEQMEKTGVDPKRLPRGGGGGWAGSGN